MEQHDDPQMTTCTRCRAVIERNPHRSGACPGWPCYAAPRPEADARLEALLQPGPDSARPTFRPPAEPAAAPPRQPGPRRLTPLRPHRSPGTRMPAQAVAAVLVTEAAPGR